MQQDHRAIEAGRWALAAMFASNGFVMGAWAPQIPLLLPRHDITKLTLGLLILVLGLGAVSAMLFAGKLIARYGSRVVLCAFALSVVPILPVVVYAPNVATLAIAMAGLGALVGCMDVAMNANAVMVERRLGRAIMSSSHGFWSLGGFFGGSLGGFMIARFGAEAHALATAAVTAVIIITAMRFIVADKPAALAVGEVRPKTVLLPRDFGIWLLGAMALFSMVPEGAVLDWAALYLLDELGSNVESSGLAFAFFAGSMALMRFAGDRVRNRFGAVRTLQVSGWIGAAGLLGAALAPTSTLAIAAFFISGLGVANMVPILFSAAGNYPGIDNGPAISTVTMVGYAGILVAPSTIGWVAEHIGFRYTYGSLALLLILVASLAHKVSMADGVKAA